MSKRKRAPNRSQVEVEVEDERVKARAIAQAKRSAARSSSRSVRGIACRYCGSRNTKTEFYRIPSGGWRFGAIACDDCGAC